MFVPPRFAASDGTVTAATAQGFRVLVAESGIRDLATGAIEPSRVLGARSAPLGVAWALRRGGPVRIHVRAKDLRRPGRADAVLAAVDAALAHVTPTTYGRAHPSGGVTLTAGGWSGDDSLGSLTHQWLWRGYVDARASCPR